MNKNLNLRMILYELRNINGNFMPHFFGIIFPNLMSLLLSKTIGGQMPAQVRQSMATSIMLTTSMIIPMAIMLLGYGCSASDFPNAGFYNICCFPYRYNGCSSACCIVAIVPYPVSILHRYYSSGNCTCHYKPAAKI